MEENFDIDNSSQESSPEQAPVKKKKKMRTWVKALCITLSVIVILLAAAVGIVWWKVNSMLDKIEIVTDESKLSSIEESEILATGGQLADPDETYIQIGDIQIPGATIEDEPQEPTAATSPAVPGQPNPPATTPPATVDPTDPYSIQGDIVNVMLIGQDKRPNENYRCRSDAMILVTFNKTTKTITMTSFMRDAFVDIPGYKPYKLNHAYQYGGMSLLNKTLKTNFGVDVSKDIAVDFSQFEKLIDKLGGVDITLTQAEADYMNLGRNWGLKAGKVRLTGEQALMYSRIRKIDSDYQRAGRQRDVLQSLINRYMSLPVVDMIAMLDDILPLVSTNMSKSEIIDLIWELAPLLTSCKYESAQIPAAGTFSSGYVEIRKGYVDWFQYNINFKKNRQILWEIFDSVA